MDLITIPVPGGSAEAYVARPESGSGPGVLLFMDAIGVRPALAAMADRIASWGYVVLVPNVFHRSGTVEQVGPHADLRAPGEREKFFGEAMPRIGELTTDLALPDIDAYLETLHGLDGVTGEHVGVLGYCMGARLAIRAATSHPDEVVACAGFHGGGLVTGALGLDRRRRTLDRRQPGRPPRRRTGRRRQSLPGRWLPRGWLPRGWLPRGRTPYRRTGRHGDAGWHRLGPWGPRWRHGWSARRDHPQHRRGRGALG
ncbi:dienelactone hydrolase family protein [Dermatophilaceae bacterium Soc4.6]